jgi:DNA modification methylase
MCQLSAPGNAGLANGPPQTSRNARCYTHHFLAPRGRMEARVRNPKLKVVELPINLIRNRQGNARTHSRKQIAKLAMAIRTYGFVVPVLVDSDHVLIAGEARVQAARLEGFSHVPAISIKHLSPEQVRALVLADNHITALGGFDKELLAKELAALVELLPMPEVLATGYEFEEIELLQDVAGSRSKQEEPTRLPAIDRSKPPVTQLGNCWLLGDHKLVCADALLRPTYETLLGSERADLVITDPPYNRRVNGEISGLGATKHPEFVAGSGELSRNQFQRFLMATCSNLVAFSRSGSLHYIFMDWRSIGDLLAVGEAHYEALQNIIVWVKSNGGGMGSLYRSQHELVALFKHGKRPHKNNVALGANGRNRTNVWQYPGANSAGQRADLKLHPTVKNLDMITEAIRDASDRGDLVLDGFAGSGTLLLAAEQASRRARLIELDPYYCDLIIMRAQQIGLEARLEGSGATYRQVIVERSAARLQSDEIASEHLS